MDREWRVVVANQAALVDAYYGGDIKVRVDSLQPPSRSFFRVSSVSCEDGRDGQQPPRKKRRKRAADQQLRLQQLIAAGKFVPLPDDTIKELTRAHTLALAGSAWALNEENNALNDLASWKLFEQCDARVVSNASDSLRYVNHRGSCAVMPPHSSCYVGDVRDDLRSAVGGNFDLIAMDPPWENKSVDRKRCYETFQHRELLKVDVASLSNVSSDEGCVLAVWVTNRPTYMKFLLDEALPHWGFTYFATWYWLKICSNGDLVSPLQSSHRLPVEKLVIATRCSSPEATDQVHRRLGLAPVVVVSIPLRHSWKPPIECFFPPLAFPGRKLELFARELRPHWVSVGNEPLKFQSSEYLGLSRTHVAD